MFSNIMSGDFAHLKNQKKNANRSSNPNYHIQLCHKDNQQLMSKVKGSRKQKLKETILETTDK